MAITPLIQSVWLADEVSQDDEGKIHIRGMFDEITLEPGVTSGAFPAWLFFAVREVHGKVELRFAYIDLQTNGVLLEFTWTVESNNPLGTCCVAVKKTMPIPHPGVYAWEVYCGDELLGSSRFAASTPDVP